MPTMTAHGLVIPSSDLEPDDLYGVATGLGNSTEKALMEYCGQAICELVAAAATSVPNNTKTKINLATTVRTDAAYYSISGSVITVLKAGLYDINGADSFSSVGSNVGELSITKNGATTNLASVYYQAAGGFFAGTPTRFAVALAANDTLQLSAKHLAGSTQSDDGTGRLTIRKVG